MLSTEDFRALADSVDRSARWPEAVDRGALSLLKPAAVAAAAAEVRTGKVISCANRTASAHRITTSIDGPGLWNAVNESVTLIQHGPASATHFDALGHFFFERATFGAAGDDIIGPEGASRLDVLPASDGIVGRGVLLDLPPIVGATYIEERTFVRLDQVHSWLTDVGTEPREGDILFVRTGRPVAPQPETGSFAAVGGLDLDCVRWVHDTGFSLIVSDNGMDCPSAKQVENLSSPWHVLCLTRLGVSLVDLADLEQLATECRASGRYSFMSIVSVPPWAGATGAPVNPLAVL